MVRDIRCRVQNDNKKAKVRLWSMFAFNLDSHDCAEDQGLKFYNVRVPEPVATAIHAGIHAAFNTAEMPSASAVNMKICGYFSFKQLLEWIMQRKNIQFAVSPQSHELWCIKCVIVRLNSQAPICVSRHFNIIWECVPQ